MALAMDARDVRRRLPAVNQVLSDARIAHRIGLYGRDVVRVQARHCLDAMRRRLASKAGAGEETAASTEQLTEDVARATVEALDRRLGQPLRRAINATGILIHTNLGRAPLPRDVASHLPALVDGACDLEIDLDTGRRGERGRRVSALVEAITGAQAAITVNNNAAALVLALGTHARGREVIVSRGELVEIGGSFRIPDILEAAGARLVEVGTTNRTRLGDFARAIGPETALLLKVHPSNYRIEGFTATVPTADLAALAHEQGVPLLVDEGSGLLRPSERPPLRDHESLSQLIEAGCRLVCGSGDKLLGGPQAGLLLGDAELVAQCRRHPLYRALRPDRTTFASLEAVLRKHLAGERLPLDRLWPAPAAHLRRLETLVARLEAAGIGRADIVDADAFVGGGAAPQAAIPGRAVAIDNVSNDAFARLRTGVTAVVGYLRDDRLIVDLRTVDPADDGALTDALIATLGGEAGV